MDFSFVQITDHHLGESEHELLRGYGTTYALRKIVRHIAENVAEHIDFIVSTGDLVNVPTSASYQHFSEVLGLQTVSPAPGPQRSTAEGLQAKPIYLIPGNHDDRANFYHYLSSQEPAPPLLNAAVEHKGVQLIFLDWGPTDKGFANPEMLDFLAQTLQNSHLPALIFMHYQIVSLDHPLLDEYMTDDAGPFWKSIEGHPVLGIFCGHAHVTYEKYARGVPIFGLRSTALPIVIAQNERVSCLLPLHYRLVTLQHGMLTTRIIEVPL